MDEDWTESNDSPKTSEEYQPKSPAMKRWKKMYLDNESKEDFEEHMDDDDETDQESDVYGGTLQHRMFCKVLISSALIGGLMAFIGHATGPQTCDNDNLFKGFGLALFWASMLGVPINVVILLISFANTEFSSGNVFLWSILHFGALVVSGVVFQEGILQDMFCDGGPGFYVTASPI